jgi:eukaryotic-like serine/threonine-protein kinase
MRLEPGQAFDRYVIEEILGRGGMGEVYRATDTRLRRKVALKVLRKDGNTDAGSWDRAVARMFREARATAALNHPGIVAVYDVGEHNRIPYIAMELVQGRTLRAVIGQSIPLEERLGILADIALALAAAHSAGLVHRDIKPENVVIREDGTVKLLDFGVARYAGPPSMMTTMEGSTSEEGSVSGTPAYMAPEQIHGDPADARTDQFAWGIVAHELLAGELPFRTDRGVGGLIASILSDPPRARVGVPKPINAILNRALEKDPADRFASMDELAYELFPYAPPREASVSSPGRSDSQVRSSVRPPRSTSARPVARPKRAAPVWIALIAAAITAVVVILVVRGVRPGLPPPRLSPLITRLAPSLTPTPLSAQPLPVSSSPEALSAYREGMERVRDAAWFDAADAFERAVSLDPAIGVAYLRLAIILATYDMASARERYRKAVLLRGTMAERDQGVLDAVEPIIQRSPPDHKEVAQRLLLLGVRYPGDPEIIDLRVLFRSHMSEGEVHALADRCLELDAAYVNCWQSKALAYAQAGRLSEALGALNRCIEIVPDAVDCRRDRAALYKASGRCVDEEEEASAWVATRAEAGAYEHLAHARESLGRPAASVEEALRMAVEAYRQDKHGAIDIPRIQVQLAVSRGAFDTAAKLLDDADRALADDNTWQWQAWIAHQRVLLLEETGRPREAGGVANAFLARREALLVSSTRPPSDDPTPFFWRIAAREGLATRERFEAERASFLREWDDAEAPTMRLGAWVAGYFKPALTPEEAREAREALPVEGTVKDPHIHPEVARLVAAGEGILEARIGDLRAALPYLQSGISDCGVLEDTYRHMHVRLQIGRAREAVGDSAGACSAYREVLARWGASRASVTAREAAARAAKIGCAMP